MVKKQKDWLTSRRAFPINPVDPKPVVHHRTMNLVSCVCFDCDHTVLVVCKRSGCNQRNRGISHSVLSVSAGAKQVISRLAYETIIEQFPSPIRSRITRFDIIESIVEPLSEMLSCERIFVYIDCPSAQVDIKTTRLTMPPSISND